MMLDKGADINAQGGAYGNALEAALVNDHEPLVQMLFERGARLDLKDSIYGITSLSRAVIDRRLQCHQRFFALDK
jgi:hypothetical protein